MSDETEALRRENAELRQQVGQLITELARLNERVSELLAVAQRKHRKPPAEKPPAAPPTLEGEARFAFEQRPKAPEKPSEEPKTKTKAKPTGRKPIPSHLEAEEHGLRPRACAGCGDTALDVVDELVEEKLHVVKEHQRRRVVRRFTCRCRACGERTTPRSLPAPYERSKVTCEWLAWLVYQKFWLLTPLDRIRRDLLERGVPIAMSTLVTLIERAAELLSGVDGLHWKQLLASRWMATDGTGLKVLVPKLPVAHNGYVELYRNCDVAVFQYEADKSSDVVVAKLQPFRGTLTADAEHRFNAVYASGRVLEAGCNAHYPESIVIRRGIPDPRDFQRRSFFERRVTIGFVARLRRRVRIDQLGACPQRLASEWSHVVDHRPLLHVGSALCRLLRGRKARPDRTLDAGVRGEVPGRGLPPAKVPPPAPIEASGSDRGPRAARSVVRARCVGRRGTSMATATGTATKYIEARARVRRVPRETPRHRDEHDQVGCFRRDQVPLLSPCPRAQVGFDARHRDRRLRPRPGVDMREEDRRRKLQHASCLLALPAPQRPSSS